MFAPRSTPVQQVWLMPREPWAPEPTKIVDGSPGFTWIDPMPRPLKYWAPIGPPVVSAVLRLVEADTRDTTAAAGVRLAGSGVDRHCRVVRMSSSAAVLLCWNPRTDVFPLRLRREGSLSVRQMPPPAFAIQ